ncbi:MAG: hypothetical protein V1664_04730 [Candidatus Uhrbacteria bacterium]
MTESFEVERQGFVEAYKTEQRRLLVQFLERHKQEDLPALDFTEEEVKIFVPKSLLALPNIDPREIKVGFLGPHNDIDGVSVSVCYGDKKDNILNFDLQRITEVFENGALPIAFVHGYSDSDLIRGKNITEDFFQTLRTIVKKIGFRVVVGENSRRNVDYFIEKLRRFPAFTLIGHKDLDPDDGLGEETYCRTYDFLYPEDASLNIKPEYLSDDFWRKKINKRIWPPFNLETGRGVISV